MSELFCWSFLYPTIIIDLAAIAMDITCQVLTKSQRPVVGMRVRLACSALSTYYEGTTSPSGLVDHWNPLCMPTASILDTHPVCSVVFAVAEYTENTPWPTIQVDLAWTKPLHHYVLLCCDDQSYSVSTSTNEPSMRLAPTPSPAGAQRDRYAVQSPMLSPMEGVQFVRDEGVTLERRPFDGAAARRPGRGRGGRQAAGLKRGDKELDYEALGDSEGGKRVRRN